MKSYLWLLTEENKEQSKEHHFFFLGNKQGTQLLLYNLMGRDEMS